MKLKLIALLLVFSPLLVLAQDEPALVKDFYKGIHAIPTSFVLNDHVNIMQVGIDDESFDVTAVDDHMQVLWRTTLSGYVISTSKFKDKILAVTATEYSKVKQNNNTFKGYIIDPANGKVLVEKVIFDGPQDYVSFPYVFTGDNGEIFKFAVRQSSFERRLHVGVAFISMNGYLKQFHETRDLDVIDFNEKLEPVFKIKPAITSGTFIQMNSNNRGDLFIGWYNNGSFDMVKYDSGKNTPSAPLATNVILDKDFLDSFGTDIFITPSKTNAGVIYYALTFKNPDKQTELGVGKLDFASGKKQYINEIFTKDHAKELKKGFVPINKKMDSPDLGPLRSLNVRMFREMNNHIVLSLTSTSSTTGMYGLWESEFNILLNNYDTDLNLKSQQIIPTSYTVPNRHLPIGYHNDKNKLYIVSNDKRGMTTLNGAICTIDLSTGQCERMDWLSKKKLGNSEMAASSSILWFGNSFVVPYLDMKGFSGSKYDITLQQNSY